MNEIISSLKTFGPQTVAIMGAAYLEHALELLLRASFRSLPKKEDTDRVFSTGAGGPLATFAAKIRIAYMATIIHEEVYKALLLINDIRNVFAHSLHLVDFHHELVAKDCIKLREIAPTITSTAGLLPLPHEEQPVEVYARFVTMIYRSIRYEVAIMKDPEPEDGGLMMEEYHLSESDRFRLRYGDDYADLYLERTRRYFDNLLDD